MLEILLDNKDGNVWDISEIVSGVTWKTVRIGGPGSLDFTLIKGAPWESPSFKYNNGDIVRVRYDGRNVFYGYIFSIDGGKNEDVRIKCYDQIRYLANSETYIFSNITASEIIRQIADDFQLRVGTIEDTVYRIPTMIEDGKKLIDIIDKALTFTLISSGGNFVLYDDFGSLTLRNIASMVPNFYIGDDSLMHGYSYKKSIDADTYNRVKLYQDNEETGKREVYIAQDSDNIAKWGLLQLYEAADENMNAAQIAERLNQLITLKNRESKSLTLNCIGEISIRAGTYLPVMIEEYGLNQSFIVDSATHRWDGDDYQMTLELKIM